MPPPYIDPAVSAWALARIREQPELSAEITARLRRIPQEARNQPAERTLYAEPISGAIGLTSLISGLLGTTAAVGGAASLIGGAIVGIPASLSVSFVPGTRQCR